ncbi:hypothetical protein DFAR_3460072 [Desulfarculales bacterium]
MTPGIRPTSRSKTLSQWRWQERGRTGSHLPRASLLEKLYRMGLHRGLELAPVTPQPHPDHRPAVRAAETSKPNRCRGFIKIGRHEAVPPKPDAPTPGIHLSSRGQVKRRPCSMIFLTQAAKNTMITRYQGVILVSRGQGCSTTLSHFLIPGSTSKIQDNGIKPLTGQAILKKAPISRSKQSKNQLGKLTNFHS